MKRFLTVLLVMVCIVTFVNVASADCTKSELNVVFITLISEGVIVDYDKYGNYYINHYMWNAFPFKSKEDLMYILACHNKIYNGYKAFWAVALSHMTGKKLAKLGAFGVKIY